MGWNTFEAFVGEYDDAILRGNVNALVDSGLKNLGYVYFNLDGGWWAYKGALRDAGGNINFNLTAATCENDPPCPVYANGKAGMKEFADFVRSKGMKFGLYMQPTEQLNTCTHLTEDVNLLKYLGVEFLKYDGYITSPTSPCFPQMRDVLDASGLQVVYSVNRSHDPGELADANMWRTSGDISNDWQSIMNSLDTVAGAASNAGPGGWNDPDFLEVGNEGVTYEQGKAQFSLWAVVAAPLLISTDLRSATSETIEILSNTEVIAVSQDVMGKAGQRMGSASNQEVWSRELGDGGRAVALLNRGNSAANISVNWANIGVSGSQMVRDLWAHADRGSFTTTYSANVPATGVVMLKIGGSGVVPPPAPGGTGGTGGAPAAGGVAATGGAAETGGAGGAFASGGVPGVTGGALGSSGGAFGAGGILATGGVASRGGNSGSVGGGNSGSLGAGGAGSDASRGRSSQSAGCGVSTPGVARAGFAGALLFGILALRRRALRQL